MADWRKAMNSGARRASGGVDGRALMREASAQRVRDAAVVQLRRDGGSAAMKPAATSATVGTTSLARSAAAPMGSSRLLGLAGRHWLVLAVLLLYPWAATPFFTFQIAGQALTLGIIALSLAFLAGYGGMVSLAQMTIAGFTGYGVAIFGTSSVSAISLGWPWWLAVLVAIFLATIFATFIGWLSVRTEGIYTIMITLAIGVAFYYLVQQNYTIFNGFQGFSGVNPPKVFGIAWHDPMPYYYLALACALAAYGFVKYLIRSPFGIALQGIRDNARRMNSLGFNVTAHRIAAHMVAGFIAAVGGVLLVWYNTLITPGIVGTTSVINILIIAVLGGMGHPIGAFIGSIVFVLLQNFAIDLVDRERFNLVIGGVFLLIVLFSPDGLLGLYRRLRQRIQRGTKAGAGASPTPSRGGHGH